MSDQLPVQREPFPVDPHQQAPTGWPAAGGVDLGEEGGGGFDVRRYLSALYRYKWLVLIVTIVGTVAGVTATRFLVPTYSAQATVWIEGRSGGRSGPIQTGQLLSESGWVELLKQFVVLDGAVQELRLYLTTESADSAAFSTFGLKDEFRTGEYRLQVAEDRRGFVLQTAEGVVVQQGTVGDSVGAELGWEWVPPQRALLPGRRIAFRVSTPREAALRLASEIDARVDRNGTFLKIALEGTDPQLIAATLNITVERYVEVAAQLKRDQLTELNNALREQLSFAATNLHNAEVALEEFQIRTITLPTDGGGAPLAGGLDMTRGPVFDNFFQLKIQREQLRQDREALERAIQAASDSGISVGALSVIPSVSTSAELTQAIGELTSKLAELRSLRYRYTDANPEVQRVLGELEELRLSAVPTIARALVGDLVARENELDRRIETSGSELEDIPARQIEEGRLARSVAIAENLFTSLQGRYEENRIAEASTQPDIRLLSSASVPSRPIANTAPRVVMLGVVVSLSLAIGLALLLDRIDRRFRYPEQVSEDLGLTIVGAVPHVRANGGGLKKAEAVQVIESLRGIRLGLAHAYGAAGPLMVTVTSPGSGDGKSFIASNLAIAFADAGHRTLLIDGDIRRGELHRVMGVSRKPGLTDLLDGSVGLDDVVQPSNHESLHIIPAGTRMAAGPELLGSNSMQQLLINARSRYGVILVDSPPLSAGVDPFVLGTATGSMLVVLRTGVTDRELAGAKMDVLERLPIRVLGAVLNDIRPTAQYRYYAYHYYVEGYEAEDETAPEDGGKRKRRLFARAAD